MFGMSALIIACKNFLQLIFGFDFLIFTMDLTQQEKIFVSHDV